MSTRFADDLLSQDVMEDIIVRHSYYDAVFMATYEENRKALLQYRFWRDNTLLPDFQELPITPVCLGANKYAYYLKGSNIISHVIEISRTQYVQKNFFHNLEKPLLVENEMNVCHWEYLYDNVRRSEDYGGDNHIYMSYDNMNEFLLFLCVQNITEFLLLEKIIFLFDKEKQINYPMNFVKVFNLNYLNRKPSMIRVEEIQRIFVNLGKVASTGNSFFMGILDSHKDVLTANGFEFADFVFIYRNALCNRTVTQVEEDFFNNAMDELSVKSFKRAFSGLCYGTKCKCPTYKKFFGCLRLLFNESSAPWVDEQMTV